MTLSNEILSTTVVAVGAALVVVTLAVVALALRLRALRRSYAAVVDAGRREDLFAALQRYVDELGSLREDVGIVHRNTEHLRELLRGAVSQVGVVRYDAFDDMGGMLSFSAALLDERGDGVVVSAINGRTESRAYAKPVSQGRSEVHLSPEELAAVEAAASGEKGVAVQVDAVRRRRRRAAS